MVKYLPYGSFLGKYEDPSHIVKNFKGKMITIDTRYKKSEFKALDKLDWASSVTNKVSHHINIKS